jgi:nitroreductase
MDLMQAIYGRRAVREYTAERVDEGLVRQLIDAAIQAPSAINRQPWLFTVVSKQALLDEISTKAKVHLLAQPITGETHHFRKMLEDPNFQIFYHAPILIVISAGEPSSWNVEDCSLAAENLMLAAYATGLGSCWIGFAQAWLGTSEGKAVLELDPKAVPVAPTIVGHPKAPPAPVPRNVPVVHWIR